MGQASLPARTCWFIQLGLWWDGSPSRLFPLTPKPVGQASLPARHCTSETRFPLFQAQGFAQAVYKPLPPRVRSARTPGGTGVPACPDLLVHPTRPLVGRLAEPSLPAHTEAGGAGVPACPGKWDQFGTIGARGFDRVPRAACPPVLRSVIQTISCLSARARPAGKPPLIRSSPTARRHPARSAVRRRAADPAPRPSSTP